MPPDSVLLGPLGLLAASLAVVGILWRDHLRADAEDRAERDFWRRTALKALGHADRAIDVAAKKIDGA